MGDHPRGEEVEVDGSEIVHGAIGLKSDGQQHFAIRRMKRTDVEKHKGSEESADPRLMGLSFQGLSRAERQWRDVSREVQQESFEPPERWAHGSSSMVGAKSFPQVRCFGGSWGTTRS